MTSSPATAPPRKTTPGEFARNGGGAVWQYSRDKTAGEDLLPSAYRDEGFPVTVVRPSHTYDRTKIALLGGWTDIHRMRQGLPVLVHGDGTQRFTAPFRWRKGPGRLSAGIMPTRRCRRSTPALWNSATG